MSKFPSIIIGLAKGSIKLTVKKSERNNLKGN